MAFKLYPAAMALAIAAGALLLTLALSHVGLFAVLELEGSDLLFVLRGSSQAPDQVVVVAIDEPSFAELGLQWPWPRSLHGELVRKLTEAGADVVGMDVLFSEASNAEEDASFTRALWDVGNVVLASEQAVVNEDLYRHTLRAEPLPVFREIAPFGVPMVLQDPDGSVRRTRLTIGGEPSFALLIAERYLERRGEGAAQPAKLGFLESENLQEPVLIDHLGPPRTIATASYYQALDYERLLPPGFFAGKAVLVGRSLAAVPEPQRLLGDTFLTPFSWLGLGPTSGVEIQATIVSNLLEGRFPVELYGIARILYLFGFLAVASLVLVRFKPVAGLLATAVFACLYVALAYLLFVQANLVVPVVAVITGLGLLYGTHLLLRATQAERARRKALEEANRNLETEVASRTRELSEAHQELTQRHSDLQVAYRDLARTQEQLVQSEKMASLGLLVAGVAHELNNPISYVNSNLDFVEEYVDRLAGIVDTRDGRGEGAERFDATKETLQELIGSCKEGTERVKQIVLDLRTFSRTDDLGRVPADLHAGIDSTLNLLAKQYEDRIHVHRDYGDLPEVECYPGQINQVFMNLLQNAAQAIAEEGDVWIVTRAEGDRVKISIRDNGSGIAQEDLKRLFDPFFTTKPVGTGTGLGLSISYSIVEKHGGKIHAHSQLSEGTEFVIELPVRPSGGLHESA